MILNSPTISGSLTVTGNIIASGSITLSGSVASASYAATASFVALAQSASNAVSAATASFANAFTVASTLTAQTLIVSTINVTQSFSSGSNIFGNALTNTQVFSGSVTMNPGGLFVSSSGLVGIGNVVPAYTLDVSGTGRFTSTLNFDGTANDGKLISSTTAATTYKWLYITNTGGSLTLGIERSTTGGLFTGTTAYATTLGSNNATDLQFATNATVRATITSAGNVGIGTSSPGYRLEVLGDGTGAGELAVKGTGTDLGIALNNTGTGGKSWRILSTGGGSGAGQGKLVTYDGTGYGWVIDSSRNVGIGTSPSSWSTANSIKALQNPAGTFWNFDVGNLYVGLNYYWDGSNRRYVNSSEYATEYQQNGSHIFFTAPVGTAGNVATLTERMRIANNGRVTITSSDSLPLVLNGTSEQYLNISSVAGKEAMTQYTQVSFSWYTGIRNTAGLSNTSGYHIYSSAYGGDIMAFNSSGAAALLGALTQNASDRRLKNNITNIPNALDKINKINGVTFNWENNIFKTDRTTDIGVIAQDIQAVLPDAVTLAPFDMGDDGNSKSGENYLTVYYEKLIPLLVEGIKELKSQNDDLQSRIETLESK
jgi:hypothetical protein